MPTTKELTIQFGRSAGDAWNGLPCPTFEGRGLVRFVVDDSTAAKKVLDNEGVSYEETNVVQTRLAHRPGELARMALRLGNADINIDYIYCGVDPSTNTQVLIFGVKDVAQAALLLAPPAAA